MFDWLTWIQRDNGRLFALVTILLILSVVWLLWAVHKRLHAKMSLEFARRNGFGSTYDSVPSVAMITLPLLILSATLLFWPAYAWWDHSQAVSLAKEIESVTGGTMNARGHGTLKDGLNIKCTFVDWSSEVKFIPCMSHDQLPDDWPGMETTKFISIRLDPPKIEIL